MCRNSLFDMSCRTSFFTSGEHKRMISIDLSKVIEALVLLLDNIYDRFGSKLLQQNVGIPMGTKCALLAADISFLS